ncbi:hypothetical protein COO60DRAFT_1131639 [Scenedesmus sp. NREL 46B-D3]|nr:hypothetical protein COO60DRAFT_1131639 [Scenedesmus sp. NREL 46B-D3]
MVHAICRRMRSRRAQQCTRCGLLWVLCVSVKHGGNGGIKCMAGHGKAATNICYRRVLFSFLWLVVLFVHSPSSILHSHWEGAYMQQHVLAVAWHYVCSFLVLLPSFIHSCVTSPSKLCLQSRNIAECPALDSTTCIVGPPSKRVPLGAMHHMRSHCSCTS